MKVQVSYTGSDGLSSRVKKQLMMLSRELLKKERLFGAQVGIVLCDDGYISHLNLNYRGQEGPTDVLSFPLLEPVELSKYRGEFQEFMLGEIYISQTRALSQANQRGIYTVQELRRLCVHGLFHLLGFDHNDRRNAISMKLKERKFMRWVQYRLLRRQDWYEELVKKF